MGTACSRLPAAYLIVANVFIYLNVRYETGSERLRPAK